MIVFQKDYNYLCDIETIIAYNYLFQFKVLQIYKACIAEKTNELARSLTLYEIQTFKTILRHRMKAIVCESLCAHGRRRLRNPEPSQVRCVGGVM
jgi:hypothetical protein